MTQKPSPLFDFGWIPEARDEHPDSPWSAWLYSSLPEIDPIIKAGRDFELQESLASQEALRQQLEAGFSSLPSILRLSGYPLLVVMDPIDPLLKDQTPHPVSLDIVIEHFDDLLTLLLTSWDTVLVTDIVSPVVLVSCLNHDALADTVPDEVFEDIRTNQEYLETIKAGGGHPHTVPPEVKWAVMGYDFFPTTAYPTHTEVLIALWRLQKERSWETRRLVNELNLTPDQAQQIFAETDDDKANPMFYRAMSNLFGSELEEQIAFCRQEKAQKAQAARELATVLHRSGVTEEELSSLMWDGLVEEVLILTPAFGPTLLSQLAAAYKRPDVVTALANQELPS